MTAVLRRHIEPGSRLTVGLSGGLDSVALLHLLSKLAESLQFKLAAHHINHHLSANADAWQSFCAELCASWQIPFAATHVSVSRENKGVEAAARRERYRAFGQPQADFVVLAHHQDDQAETLLLQLFRGAGVRGLSGMPEVRDQESDVRNQESGIRSQVSGVRCQEGGAALARIFGSPALLRPLLQVPRPSLRQYAMRHGLRWIDDESNDDVSYARNFLRHRILPTLAEHFPAASANLARAAGHYAEARQLLEDLAELDARGAIDGDRLEVSALASLSEPRAKNLLRFFIHGRGLPMPDQDRLREMLRQLLSARDDAGVCIVHEGHELRRFRAAAYLVKPFVSGTAEISLSWQGETAIEFSQWHGSLRFEKVRGAGLAARVLQNNQLTVRLRRGGERLRLHAAGRSRTLKNLLQESAMPPWQRNRLPLLLLNDQLICAPGIGVDAACQCPAVEEGVHIYWQPQ
ncbi:MAG: tRNA lysidine(34) synthetase TilS [Burkholderiales bacterium]|nr:tRNA lysidine(34) synthetase TilS [Burkholderiales bacterium]